MAKKLYISFGPDGVMSGRYTSVTHDGKNIPESAVEVTAELFKRTLDECDGQWFKNDYGIIEKRPFGDPPFTERAAINAVRNHLDEAAQAAGYDGIAVAASYAEESSVPKFQSEGKRFRAWRSLCWEKCFAVLSNSSSMTISGLISSLPKLPKA